MTLQQLFHLESDDPSQVVFLSDDGQEILLKDVSDFVGAAYAEGFKAGAEAMREVARNKAWNAIGMSLSVYDVDALPLPEPSANP